MFSLVHVVSGTEQNLANMPITLIRKKLSLSYWFPPLSFSVIYGTLLCNTLPCNMSMITVLAPNGGFEASSPSMIGRDCICLGHHVKLWVEETRMWNKELKKREGNTCVSLWFISDTPRLWGLNWSWRTNFWSKGRSTFAPLLHLRGWIEFHPCWFLDVDCFQGKQSTEAGSLMYTSQIILCWIYL